MHPAAAPRTANTPHTQPTHNSRRATMNTRQLHTHPPKKVNARNFLPRTCTLQTGGSIRHTPHPRWYEKGPKGKGPMDLSRRRGLLSKILFLASRSNPDGRPVLPASPPPPCPPLPPSLLLSPFSAFPPFSSNPIRPFPPSRSPSPSPSPSRLPLPPLLALRSSSHSVSPFRHTFLASLLPLPPRLPPLSSLRSLYRSPHPPPPRSIASPLSSAFLISALFCLPCPLPPSLSHITRILLTLHLSATILPSDPLPTWPPGAPQRRRARPSLYVFRWPSAAGAAHSIHGGTHAPARLASRALDASFPSCLAVCSRAARASQSARGCCMDWRGALAAVVGVHQRAKLRAH